MKNYRFLFALFALAAVFTFFSCTQNTGNGGQEIPDDDDKELAIIDDDPDNPVPHWDLDTRTRKVSRNGKPILNTVWCEGAWQDPRIAIGYKFQGGPLDGKLWFDRYVQLYGGRLTDRDCATNPAEGGEHCKKTGLHLHLDKMCYDVLEGHNTYIKPLQEAGIKFLIGLVPNNTGVAHGTLYSWPMEDVAPWQGIYPSDTEYPFGEAAVASLINDIKEARDKYGFDGVAFDDEYGNVKGATGWGRGNVYPNNTIYYTAGSPGLTAALKRGGWNMFRFIYDLHKAMPGIVLENYEIKYGEYIPESMDIVDEGGAVYYGDKADFPEEVRDKAVTIHMKDYVSASYAVYYGTWDGTPGMSVGANHIPRSMYGPLPMDIGAHSGVSNPPGDDKFSQYMQDHVDANYGVLMYYALYDHDGYNTPNYFGNGRNKPEDYFTMIARKIFYDDAVIVYEGDNYKLPWNN